MPEDNEDRVKQKVEGGSIALPWELVPPEIVKKALELMAIRLESLPPLLQASVIQLGYRPRDTFMLPSNVTEQENRRPREPWTVQYARRMASRQASIGLKNR